MTCNLTTFKSCYLRGGDIQSVTIPIQADAVRAEVRRKGYTSVMGDVPVNRVGDIFIADYNQFKDYQEGMYVIRFYTTIKENTFPVAENELLITNLATGGCGCDDPNHERFNLNLNGLIIPVSINHNILENNLNYEQLTPEQQAELVGPPGPPGPQGIQGPQGMQGVQGVPGPQGERGIQGEKGDKGDVGPQGPIGLTGATGPVGPQGATGPQGPQGETGATGPQGIQGVQGPKGDTGAKGDIGPQGVAGPAGPQGPKGDTGNTGESGIVVMSQQMKVAVNVVASEAMNFKTVISTANITLTVPTGLPDGFQTALIADGGSITLATSGTAFKLNSGKVVLGIGKTAALIKENGTANFYLKGELS